MPFNHRDAGDAGPPIESLFAAFLGFDMEAGLLEVGDLASAEVGAGATVDEG
jgi:hypothetical protein